MEMYTGRYTAATSKSRPLGVQLSCSFDFFKKNFLTQKKTQGFPNKKAPYAARFLWREDAVTGSHKSPLGWVGRYVKNATCLRKWEDRKKKKPQTLLSRNPDCRIDVETDDIQVFGYYCLKSIAIACSRSSVRYQRSVWSCFVSDLIHFKTMPRSHLLLVYIYDAGLGL